MLESVRSFFMAEGLPPHGFCLLWQPGLIWTHVIADALIALSYFSIPLVLATFVRRRHDIAFGWIFWCFAAFIMACGTTHLMSIWTLWNADYGVEAVIKIVTAIVSVITAVILWPLLPRALALPSPETLRLANVELAHRVEERDQALAAARAEADERAKAEEALRQAQKLEAVGQLTSGVAHDFNNLLTAIIGNLDMLERRLPADDALGRKAVENALAGAERAAALTSRLLAFARRQPLQPQPLDLNDIVLDLRELLAGSLGAGIDLRFDLDEALWTAEADRNQLENALINLTVNARDAMPDGGRVTVKTENLHVGKPSDDLPAGDYVAISVTDTGHGMTPDVLARAFDPFFTTKEVGRGTGLGLSQVYGFASQSGGRAELFSIMQQGTTVRVLLPRTRAAGQGHDIAHIDGGG